MDTASWTRNVQDVFRLDCVVGRGGLLMPHALQPRNTVRTQFGTSPRASLLSHTEAKQRRTSPVASKSASNCCATLAGARPRRRQQRAPQAAAFLQPASGLALNRRLWPGQFGSLFGFKQRWFSLLPQAESARSNRPRPLLTPLRQRAQPTLRTLGRAAPCCRLRSARRHAPPRLPTSGAAVRRLRR